jgi:UDP-glucose 4-epimerase
LKVLVTGGAGFIGSHVADRMVADGHDVAVVDDLSSGRREQVPGAANLYQMDVESRWLDRVIERERPEAVIHLAAQVSVSRSMREPMFDAQVNVLGSLGLVLACRQHGVRRLVFASTGGAIYGDTEVLPTPETFPAWPESPYGAAKLAVEHYLHLFHRLDGFSAACLRFANVYGPRQDPHGEAGVVAIFAGALLEGRAPTIHGDGRKTRDYVYVGDVVEAVAAAMRGEACGAFNIGTGIETDVNRLYGLIAGAAGSDLAAVHGPDRPGDVERSCLAIGRATEVLGWRPRVELAEGVALTVDYFRQRVAATA